MKVGDLVRNISARNKYGRIIGELGLFMGFKSTGGYEYAEVMWFNRSAPNGDRVSSIQKSLIEVVNESR